MYRRKYGRNLSCICLLLLLCLASCQRSEQKPVLPFYNQADFTPLFFQSMSEADQAIVGAAADLVPELRIANRGDCSLNPASIQEQVAEYEANKPYAGERRGNSAVVKGRLSAEDALAVASFQRIADQQVGCVPNFKYDFAKPIKGQAFVTLRFPKGAWD